ncbi:MAG: glycoside hydrolase family 2 [Clostridia bacterium]|nr:glycoside hydrolase family 2 [Clostridia bacterium]
MKLKTNYRVGEIPLSEYPRPQLRRDSYVCLNGQWELKKYSEQGEELFSGKILVPFSPETLLSGVEDGFSLEKNEKLVYRRVFALPTGFVKDVTLLHFGAVDQACEVFLNGEWVCAHRGGYTPFTADITAALKSGENELVVKCTDQTEANGWGRGKQSSNPGTIWYTKQSGIWQTVWLESVPSEYFKTLKIKPDYFTSSVKIETDLVGKKTVRVFDGERLIFEQAYSETDVTICYPFEPWTPEKPKLYTFTLESESGDKIESYFGMRSFGEAKDCNGKMRLTLNGKPYFMNGVLDQGYWCDGLLTHPCDEAIVNELTLLKEMGFNMVRKHIKVEPLRWYYHCDRLGLIVWQDFVNGGGEYNFWHIAAFPFLGFKHKDSDYAYFSRENDGGREEFISSFQETVETLYNCVSIGVWVPFNEGWGQFDSAEITERLRALDNSRIIDSVSGWHDQGVGKTQLKSLHIYYTPIKVPKDERPVVLSEFGGYSMQTEGHVFNPEKEFGYKKFKDQESLVCALEKLYLKKLKPLIQKGLCACVYTQVSDVEEEINGLVTYDRKVVKVPVEAMRKINEEIKAEAEKVR